MAEGYTVEEAAQVLGVPQSRVWELIARGVLAGYREGDDDMRVFLQPPAESVGVQHAEAGTGTDTAAFVIGPFRELLSEFRNLTERYGQALLALGESRGEVASLRNRVELLEARMDLRLPSSASSEPIATSWAAAAPVETDVDIGESLAPAVAESDTDSEDAVAAANEEVGERTRRRARVTRPGKARIAEALARADDPTTALPGADAGADADAEPEPAAVAAVFDDSSTLDQPIATDPTEASVQPEVEEASAPQVVEPPYQGRYATTFDEPDWISEAELDGSYWRTPSDAQPEAQPEAEPEAESDAAAAQPESSEAQPEAEPDAAAAQPESSEAQPEAEPDAAAAQPEAEPWVAVEPLDVAAEPEREAWIEDTPAAEEAASQPGTSIEEQVASEAADETEPDVGDEPGEEWSAIAVAEVRPASSDIGTPAFEGEAASADEPPPDDVPPAETEGEVEAEAVPEPIVEDAAAERESLVAEEASVDEASEDETHEPEAESPWTEDPRLAVLGAWDEDLAQAAGEPPSDEVADAPDRPPPHASREHPEEEELMWLGLDYPASDYAAELELPTAGWRPAAPVDTAPADLVAPATVPTRTAPTVRQPIDVGGMDAIRALLAAPSPTGEARDESALRDADDADDASVKAMVASWVPHDAFEPDSTDVTTDAPRSYPGASTRRRLTLPGSRELDDALVALGVTPEASDATESPEAPEPPDVDWAKRRGDAEADADDEAIPRTLFVADPPIHAPDPEWLRGRRDPAARAFRRLRRLFPS